MKNINEGLRQNDLVGMISSIVSIDEYKSKIDDSALVIAFYVTNKNAAADLNRFIQKSYVEILDTEISAAPDQAGFYLIFVEMMLNDQTAKGISDLCREISSLVGATKWEIRVRGEDDTTVLPLDKIHTELSSKLQGLLENMMTGGGVHQVVVADNCFEAFNGAYSMRFTVKDQGSFDTVYARNRLSESPVNMRADALRGSRKVKAFLGSNWAVECIGEHFAAHNTATDTLLLLSFHDIV